jgi:hypothetical protein
MTQNRSIVGLSFVLGFLTLAANAQTPHEGGWSRTYGPGQAAISEGRRDWWARYGEPVNAGQLAAQAASASLPPGAAVSLYGPGYVYAPGSCDCPPPCIWDLWTGYFQNPKRCHPGCGWLHGRCGCCTAAHCPADGVASCRSGCLGTRMRDVLGHCHACQAGCGQPAGCGCTVPAAPAQASGSPATVPAAPAQASVSSAAVP